MTKNEIKLVEEYLYKYDDEDRREAQHRSHINYTYLLEQYIKNKKRVEPFVIKEVINISSTGGGLYE